MKYNEVQYILRNPQLGGILLKYEPINWNDSKRENIRSQDHWGVFTKLSEENEFVKDGYKFIKNIKETQGTEATCIINRQVRPDYNGNWQTDYFGYLDFKTYSESNERLKIKIKTGGLQSLIENQWDEEFELERETDINGNNISTISNLIEDNGDFDVIIGDYDYKYKLFEWTGRKIKIISTLKEGEKTFTSKTQSISNDFWHKPIPLSMFSTREDRAFNQLIPFSIPNVNLYDGIEQGAYFYRVNNYTEINVNINLNLTIEGLDTVGSGTQDSRVFSISLIKLQSDENFENFTSETLIDEKTIADANYSGDFNETMFIGADYNYSYENVITLNEFEVLGIYIKSKSNYDQFRVHFKNHNSLIVVKEDSFFKPTIHKKALKPLDYFKRLTEIITGDRNNFKSDYFENENNDEVIANSILMTGMHLRNNPDAVHKASLKKVFSLSAFKKLGWGIETINGREVLRVEPIEYFLDKTNKIDIGKVDELTEKVEPKYLYKSLGFGNPDAGEYEQSIGNTEYNTFNTYFTPLKTAENKYNAETELRHDMVAAEVERRKQWNETVDEDEEYDDEIFIFDVKKKNYNGNLNTEHIYSPRGWQDDFAQQPEQIYDPESAGNLRLTPFRCLIRHSNFFTSGMEYYQSQKVGYKSTQGQADVIIDGLSEKGEKTINELANPFFTAEMYEFEKPLTFEIKNILKSKTNNKLNLYFIVKFVYRNEVKEGFLINVTENNNSKWKLLKIR